MKKIKHIFKSKSAFILLLGIILSSFAQGQTWDFMNFPSVSQNKNLHGATLKAGTEEVFTLESVNGFSLSEIVKYDNGSYIQMNSYFPQTTYFYDSPNIITSDNNNIYVGANAQAINNWSDCYIYSSPQTSNGGQPLTYIPITCSDQYGTTTITSVVSNDQYLYITGYCRPQMFGHSLDFGSTNVPLIGNQDQYFGFVAKYSLTTNTFDWANIVSRCDYESYPKDVSVDNNGNVFVTGILHGAVPVTIFDSGGSTNYTPLTLAGHIGHDSFIFKMNSLGVMDLTWGFKHYAADDYYHDAGNDIKIDPTDDAVYFVSKRDEIKKHSTLGTGNLIWTKTIPNASINQIALNSCENIYATGIYSSNYFSQSFNKFTTVDNWTSRAALASSNEYSAGIAVLMKQDDKVEILGDYNHITAPFMTIDSETPSTISSGIFYGRLESDCAPCIINPSFTYSSTVDDLCTFDFSNGTTILGVNTLRSEWTVNGSIVSTSNGHLTHTFPSNGTYTVCLTVYGDNGQVACSNSFCEDIIVTCLGQTYSCGDDCEIENLVIDGDFETGNTFLTSLNLSCSCTGNSYCIGSEPRDKCVNSLWIDNLWDHTLGTSAGNYMLVDGPSSYPATIWNQGGINVTAGETYRFSFWNIREISSRTSNISTQTFDMLINGAVVNTVSTASLPNNEWVQYCTEWTATTSGTISIQLNQTAGDGFNDYGIDDIEFGTCGSEPVLCVECDIDPEIQLDDSGDDCTFELVGVNNGTECSSQLYRWDIYSGSGILIATLSDQNTSYTFPTEGDYQVCLTIYVLDADGQILCEEHVCKDLQTSCDDECDDECDIDPEIEVDSQGDCTFELVGINNGIECSSQLYHWDISGNSISTSLVGQNISYTFPQDGTYDICLTIYVLDDDGEIECEEESCTVIEVKGCDSDEAESVNVLKAWPNPSNDGLYYLDINSEDFDLENIRIYNTLGNEISFTGNNKEEGLPFVELQTDEVGMYLLILQKGDQIMKTTLIKY